MKKFRKVVTGNMKILVVEDDIFKRQNIECFLYARNIDMHLVSSVNPAIEYIIEHSDEISGVLLDMGLSSYDGAPDYHSQKGLEVVNELTKRKINIPILINSSTLINMSFIMENNKNVKGQMCINTDGYKKLEWFINLLEGKE